MNGKSCFALAVGLTYGVFGTMQTIYSIGVDSPLFEALLLENSIIGGIILVIIGIVFLSGYFKTIKDPVEGIAFIFTGILVSVLYMALYIMVLLANAMLGLMESSGLNVQADLIPLVYLGVIPLLGYIVWRHSFSFIKLSKAGA